MKIVLAQTKTIWENREANLEKAEMLLECCKGKSDLLLFPEMSFTGFSTEVMKHGEEQEETLQAMKELVKKADTAVGFGWAKKVNGKCRNHYTILQPDGTELLDFAKIHPFTFSQEEQYVEGGDSLAYAPYKEFTVGTAICYDLRFPELFSALSKKADFIVVPANWPASRGDQWSCLLKARSVENQCYMAGINCVGSIGGLFYTGNSAIYDPKGELLKSQVLWEAEADGERECLLSYEIENEAEEFRREFPCKQDRREELYKRFWDEMNL